MPAYGNNNGNSSVSSYDYGDDYIKVTFTSGVSYSYTYASAGQAIVDRMKALADSGSGLNSFIQSAAYSLYESKG